RCEDVRDLAHGADGTGVQVVGRVPIPAGMDDSFAFGKPSRKRALPAARRPKAPKVEAGSGRGRIVLVVAAGVIAVVLIAGYMTFLKGSGEQIASGERSAISQIGAAKDVEAQTTEQQAVTAVQELYAEQGSFDGIRPAALKRFEPAFTYSAGASTGPNVVGVSSTAGGVGLAVLSQSGTCFSTRFTATGPASGGVAKLLDGQARDAAERALALARGALGRGDLAALGAAQLAEADPTLLFVDGASTAPSIVSFAVSGGVWAAAVMGPSGACYGVSIDTHGVVRYDRSRPCTGQAALAAARTTW